MNTFFKTTTTEFTPVNLLADFYTFDEKFIKMRENSKYKANKCFICDRPFNVGEKISLVSLVGVGNKVICRSCADRISTPK